jgi:hypothetical protein
MFYPLACKVQKESTSDHAGQRAACGPALGRSPQKFSSELFHLNRSLVNRAGPNNPVCLANEEVKITQRNIREIPAISTPGEE